MSGASYDVYDVEEAQVTFTKSNVKTTWTSKENLSILQLAEKAGLKPEYGCRSGVCGTCECKLLKGQVHGPEGWESDSRLICQSKPASTEIEIDL